MKIDGLTVCVGEEYCAHLRKTLPLWLKGLNSLTVVTKPGDAATLLPDVRVITTGVFTAYGASFNKGAALCEAYAATDPQEWVLHFDADILPPADWYKHMEVAQRGCLHGVQRFSEEGAALDELPIFPYGYFHLWHSSDPVTWRWPLFEPWHGHAGHYDAEFAERWHRSKRVDLGFPVTHLGEPRCNWFGPGGDRVAMETMRKRGLRRVRLMSRYAINRLQVPKPMARMQLLDKTETAVRKIRSLAAALGPFTVELV